MADDLRRDPGDQGADRSGSRVGALLRTAREATGRNLQSVSQQLRIRSVYLRAIEEGDFGALPGTTYAVGFVRSYADFLGLDGPDIVRRFREEVEELGRRTHLVFPATPAEGKIPGGAIVLMAILIAGIVYGTWFYLSDRERSLAGLIPEVPAELKSLLGSGRPAPAEAPPATAGSANPTIETPAPVAPTGSAATTSSATDSSAPATASNGETTAGVATASDEQAAAAITLAPSGASGAANTDEEEVPPAPDEADAATLAATEGQAGAAGAQDLSNQEIVEAPPALGSAGAESPTITTPSAATTTSTAPVASTGTAAMPAGTAPAAPAAAQQAATTTAPPAPPPAPALPEDSLPRGQDYGVTNGESRVVLVARQEAWVQVSGANQEVWTRVLRPGDRYLVPNDPSLTLSTGNAGGLDILVDGKKVPSLGPVGVVRRGISLDPKRLLGGAALP
jgi:cytoskeleton protein RodZ